MIDGLSTDTLYKTHAAEFQMIKQMRLHFALLVNVDAFRGGSVSAVPFRRGQFLVKTRQINRAGKCKNLIDTVGDLCIEENTKTFHQVS